MQIYERKYFEHSGKKEIFLTNLVVKGTLMQI